MGWLMSGNKKINNITFAKIPNRVTKVEKICRLNGVMYFTKKNDSCVYTDCNWLVKKASFTQSFDYPFVENALKALVKLGLIDNSDLEEHLSGTEEINKKIKTRNEMKKVKRLLDNLDLKLQKRSLDKLNKEVE